MFPNTEEKPVSDGIFPFIVCCCCFARSRVEPRLFLHGGIGQISARLWKAFFVASLSICSTCKMYLSKSPNIFYQITKCICPNCKIVFVQIAKVFVQIPKFICQNSKIEFVQIAKCIYPNFKMYLSKLWNVFVQIDKLISPELQNVVLFLHGAIAQISVRLWKAFFKLHLVRTQHGLKLTLLPGPCRKQRYGTNYSHRLSIIY